MNMASVRSATFGWLAVISVSLVSTASADVDLALVVDEPFVPAGETFAVRIEATASPGTSEEIFAISVVLAWDPAAVTLVEADDSNNSTTWLVSGFLNDPDGVNDSLDDGDAIFTALAPPGDPALITDEPFVVTTLIFEAAPVTGMTTIGILSQIGDFGQTEVLRAGNVDVLGETMDALVAIVACGTGDADGDTDVDLRDISALWTCFSGEDEASPGCACLFDSDEDTDVDLADAAEVFQALTGP